MSIAIPSLKKENIDLNRYINYSLIGYAFFLPFSKAGVNFFEIIMLLLWMFQGKWYQKWQLYKKNILILAILSLIGLSLVSIFWASSIEFALKYIAKYRHFLIILVIYSALDKRYIHTVFSAFLMGMFISEIVSYGIFFELWTYKNTPPSDPSPFMSHTDYSIYLAFTSILLLTRILDKNEHNLKFKLVYLVFFLSSTTNLFVNGGRTGQFAFIALIMTTVFMSFQNKFKALIISLFLVISIFFVAFQVSPNFHDRFNQFTTGMNHLYYNDDYTSSLSQRILLWKLGVLAFRDHAFIGTGIGNDMKGISEYANELEIPSDKRVDLNSFGDHHNTFITLSVQLGIGGLFISIWIFYALISLQFKNKYYKILNITFVVGFFLWSFSGITFHTMNPMIFFSFFAGLFNKISQLEQDEGVMV